MKNAVLLLAALMIAGCAKQEPLPAFGQVPEFRLTADTGQPFASQSLAGKIWVADFIYTNCTGPCPRMSSLMRQVQSSTMTEPVQLVSFTVNPERDTPAVLAAYAKRFHADPAKWIFLTGPQETLHALKREAFKLGSVDGSLNHSTRLVLIDRKGRVRGYYGTEDEDPIAKVVRDIRRLEKEPA